MQIWQMLTFVGATLVDTLLDTWLLMSLTQGRPMSGMLYRARFDLWLLPVDSIITSYCPRCVCN